MRVKQKLPGFTLLELLAVIAIIGILTTLAAVSISNATKRGRDAKRQNHLATIKQALELYAQDEGQYPASLEDLAASDHMGNLPIVYLR